MPSLAPSPATRRHRVQAGLTVLVLLVGLAAYVGWRWWHDRPPYGPETLAATVTLELVGNDAATAALGTVRAPFADVGDQLVLGRVTWQPPIRSHKSTMFWVVVLDKRTRTKPAIFEVTSPRQADVGSGSHGYLRRAAERYPWLRGIAGHQVNGSWQDAGSTIYVAASDATPLTFVALFPARSRSTQPEIPIATAPVAISDLLVALVHMGRDGQLYWAQRLLG